MTELYLQI